MFELSDFIPGTFHFRWHDALWLPKWGVHVVPTLEQKSNIIAVADKLQKIRNLLNKPIVVTSWLRPENYNNWKKPYGVQGAVNSCHMKGMAVDFYVDTLSCDWVREFLEPKLEEMKIRMERKPKSAWVHVDTREPGPGGRYFNP